MTRDKEHTQGLPVAILAAQPPDRVKLDSLLASIAREAGGLTDEKHALIERAHQVAGPWGVSY